MALIRSVSRTTIFVRDIERSLAFWRDMLGLSVEIKATIPNPGASQILGEKCEAIRVTVLSAENVQTGNIGLAEVIGGEPPLSNPPMDSKVRLGETCLVIRTDHLSELLPVIKSVGTVIISEPTKLELPIEEEVWEMFLRDPDGILINLSHHGPWSS